ncbi:hypothetical protein [Streptomyces sp. NPDC050355]|uniref:hypothetical protein n=1 Tax=Streptomyces sp. NPDC050355 TaxID=3365609 RepID=UPI0037B03898
MTTGRWGGWINHRAVPEPDRRLVAVPLHVVDGEVADAVDVLGVEQEEQAGGPVVGESS